MSANKKPMKPFKAWAIYCPTQVHPRDMVEIHLTRAECKKWCDVCRVVRVIVKECK